MNAEREPQEIAVVGTGYVGMTVALCMAELGHTVRGFDISEHRIGSLKAGQLPIYEPGLEKLLVDHQASGRVVFTDELDTAVRGAGFVFLCVPTPSAEDGSVDTSYLRTAARSLIDHLDAGAVVVNKSTVPVGSTVIVREEIGRDDVSVVSNPEFLREGSAFYDFMNPDRVVIGADNDDAAEAVANLYRPIETEYVLTDPPSAELIKYVSNAYLAMRLSFVNAAAEACEVLGAQIDEVARGIGLDSRIGPAFLRPGPGWGGSCFPKDTKALVAMSGDAGYEFNFLRSVIDANDHQMERTAEKAMRLVSWHGRIAALGIAFKANTDDVRDSPAVAIIDRISSRGVGVIAHDPKATMPIEGIEQRDDIYDACADADLVAVLTEWPEYSELDIERLGSVVKNKVILDTRGVIDADAFRSAGWHVHRVGHPS